MLYCMNIILNTHCASYGTPWWTCCSTDGIFVNCHNKESLATIDLFDTLNKGTYVYSAARQFCSKLPSVTDYSLFEINITFLFCFFFCFSNLWGQHLEVISIQCSNIQHAFCFSGGCLSCCKFWLWTAKILEKYKTKSNSLPRIQPTCDLRCYKYSPFF